jgi:hypothetical protein
LDGIGLFRINFDGTILDELFVRVGEKVLKAALPMIKGSKGVDCSRVVLKGPLPNTETSDEAGV